jgi:hypothetical protein
MLSSQQQEELRNLIDEMNMHGRNIPSTISELQEIPYQNFESFINDSRTGEVRLLRFSFEMIPTLLEILGTKSRKLRSNAGMFLMFGGSIGALVAAFSFSWWFLLLIPVCFIKGKSISKQAYNDTIFESAFDNEQAFCFLFYIGQISLDIDGFDEQIYHRNEE